MDDRVGREDEAVAGELQAPAEIGVLQRDVRLVEAAQGFEDVASNPQAATAGVVEEGRVRVAGQAVLLGRVAVQTACLLPVQSFDLMPARRGLMIVQLADQAVDPAVGDLVVRVAEQEHVAGCRRGRDVLRVSGTAAIRRGQDAKSGQPVAVGLDEFHGPVGRTVVAYQDLDLSPPGLPGQRLELRPERRRGVQAGDDDADPIDREGWLFRQSR